MRTPRGTSTTAPPLLLIYSVTMTGIMLVPPIAPLAPEIVADLDAPASFVGLVHGLATLPGILLAPVVGLLADRVGRRIVLVPCLALFGAAGLLCGLAPSIEILLTLRFFQGIGSAGLINLAIVLIGDYWSGTDQARYIGRNSAVLTSAIVVMPPLGGGIAELVGWRGVFLIYLPALVVSLWAARRLPAHRRAEEPVRLGRQLRIAGQEAREPGVLAFLLISVVIFIWIFGAITTVLPLHAAEEYGMGAAARGLVLALPAITASLVALAAGWLRDRVASASVVLASFAGFGTGFFLLGVEAATLAYLVVGALIIGAAEGLVLPRAQGRIASAGTGAARGSLVALWVSAVRLGQTTGPLAGGALAAGIGTGPTLFLAAASAGAFLVAAVLWRLAGRR